jgi:ABC-2 type transport system permease protein
MRGLLLKDLYTLIKRMKFMLFLLLVMACIPGYSMAAFAMFYAAMLPVTALAYDERSKWDELAAMMPYSVRDIVLSKYALGAFFLLSTAALGAAAQLVTDVTGHTGPDKNAWISLLIMACLALIMMAINLPIMFKLGVEKGRMIFILLVCGAVAAGMTIKDYLLASLEGLGSLKITLAGILMATFAICIGSVPLSISMYKKRRG